MPEQKGEWREKKWSSKTHSPIICSYKYANSSSSCKRCRLYGMNERIKWLLKHRNAVLIDIFTRSQHHAALATFIDAWNDFQSYPLYNQFSVLIQRTRNGTHNACTVHARTYTRWLASERAKNKRIHIHSIFHFNRIRRKRIYRHSSNLYAH